MSEAITKAESGQMEYAMSVEGVMAQVNAIQELTRRAMREGEHYGIIPGTSRKDKDGKEKAKPSLLKPGAEKLSMMFRLSPTYQIEPILYATGHLEYRIICTLTSIRTGEVWGQGVGSCSTMETKYRFRKAEQVCPKCGQATIIKGKQEYGGGWLCYQKKGGCGAKFLDGDVTIENQNMGRIEHDNPADYYNTVLKMAKKRAQVDAILTVTAASDLFTQDLEDMADNGLIKDPQTKDGAKAAPPATPTTAQPAAAAKEALGPQFGDTEPPKGDVFDSLENELYDFCEGDQAKMEDKLQGLTSFPGKDRETNKPNGKIVPGKRTVAELRENGKTAWAGSALKKLRDEVAGER